MFAAMDWRKIINVSVKPQITIEPQNIKIDDRIRITVSFETSTAAYAVKFGEISETQKTFTADITVIPPGPETVVAQVITKHSHAYTLESLAAGDYRFVVLINGVKAADARISVGPESLVIETPVSEVVEVSERQELVLERTIENKSEAKQQLIYILQLKDSAGLTISLSWIEEEIPPNDSVKISQSWIPESSGSYTLQIFVWESMDNPNVLAPMRTVTIHVS
jgi:hypothetical protein